jgi:Domain of unknown function (DUF4383)
MAVDVAREPVRERAPLRDLALLVGLAFLAVGIAGFIPGITTDYGDLRFAGHHSGAKLFGVFQVSILHNLVHLLFGVAGIALSRTSETARTFLVGGGLIYLGLTLYGAVTGSESGWNFVPLDRADDLLHLFLGLGMLGFGVLPERSFGRPGETLAGFLASAALFVSLLGLAYRPLRLIPFAILIALVAAAIGGRHGRLATLAVCVGAGCLALGLALAVVTSNPLW